MIDSESVFVQSYRINKDKNWFLSEYKEISDTLTLV